MRKILFVFIALLGSVCVFAQIKHSEKIVSFGGGKYYLHKVQLGQTLYGIGKSYGVSVARLLQVNKKKTASLKEGEILKVPFSEEKRVVQTLKYKHYIVKKDDTLWALAKKFHTTTEQLTELNAGVEVALVEGRRLIVPAVVESQGSYDSQYYYHIVSEKQTLSKIARYYKISLRELKKCNKKIHPNGLHKGDEIRIPIKNAYAQVQKLRRINTKTVGQKEVFVEKERGGDYKPLTKIPSTWNNEPYEQIEQIQERFDSEGNLLFSPYFASLYKMLVFLPLKNSSPKMLSYYRGMLFSMKQNEDLPIEISVFDSEQSLAKVSRILTEKNDADFIIGPYLESVFSALLPSVSTETKVVSLLSKNTAVFEYQNVLQINTTEKTINKRMARYAIEEHFGDNVVLFNGRSFEKYRPAAVGLSQQIENLAQRLDNLRILEGETDYQKSFDSLVDKEKKNVVLVPVSDYKTITKVLNALNIYSMHDVEVVGYYKWRLLSNIAPELLFNLKLTYFTPFHYVPRAEEDFVIGYKEYFQEYPDDFSFMGYQTMQRILKGIRKSGANFYQNPEENMLKHQNGGYENSNLIKVQFQKDYQILAE